VAEDIFISRDTYVTMKPESIDRRLRQTCDSYIETVKHQLDVQVKQNRYRVLKEINTELGFVSLSAAEHEKLLESSTKTKDTVDAEVAKQLKESVAKLQATLDHELEKKELHHLAAIATFKEEIKFLNRLVAGSAEAKAEETPEEGDQA